MLTSRERHTVIVVAGASSALSTSRSRTRTSCERKLAFPCTLAFASLVLMLRVSGFVLKLLLLFVLSRSTELVPVFFDTTETEASRTGSKV